MTSPACLPSRFVYASTQWVGLVLNHAHLIVGQLEEMDRVSFSRFAEKRNYKVSGLGLSWLVSWLVSWLGLSRAGAREGSY